MPVITELLARLGIDVRDFEKGLRQAERTLSKNADKMISIGRSLTTGITVPAAAIGGIAVKSFADFDDALRRSAAIMTGAEGRMEDLSEAARKIGRESTFGATQAAEAFFFLASAGLDAEKSIKALPEVVRFAEAGSFDLATATDLLTDAQSALGLSAKDAEQNLRNLVRVSDVLVGANTFANASTRQFSEALTAGAGAAARNAGLDIESTVAILAAYADQGIKGADASTKLRVALRDLQSKAFANAETFKRLGVTVFDANTGALLPMSEILKSLERRFDGMTARSRIATIRQLDFADKSKAALESLLGFSEAIAMNTAKLREIGGVTKDVAAKNLASFSSQMKILKNQVVDVAIALGAELVPIIQDNIVPVVEDAIEFVRGLVKWFSELDKGTKDMIVSAVAFAASVGPVLVGLGAFIKLIIAATNPVTILATAIGAITLGLVELGKQFLISEDGAVAYAGGMVGATKAMRDAAAAGRTLNEELRLIELRGARQKVDDAREALERLRDEFANNVREGRISNESMKRSREEAENLRKTIDRLQKEYEELAAATRKANESQVSVGGGGGDTGLLDTITQIGDGLKGVAELGVVTGQSIRDSFNTALAEMESNSSAVYGRLGGHVSAYQQAANEAWNTWLSTSQEVFANVQLAAVDFLNSFSSGFGQALAQIIVYQEDFGEVFKAFLKNLLAQVIQTLTQIVVQWILATILQYTVGTAGHIARVGQALQMVYLNSFAAIAAIPFVGPTIAPGAAAAATATASAGSIAAAAAGPAVGGAGSAALGLDTGGMLTADGMAFLHRGEVVATPDEVKSAMTGGKQPMDVSLIVDGRTLARVLLPYVSREVRLRGA